VILFLKVFNPITNGIRHKISLSSFNINNKKIKIFTSGFKKDSGKNNSGKTVVWSKKGSIKNNTIILTNYSNFLKKIALCINLTKDSSKSALLALIKFSNGSYSYILSPFGLSNGSFIRFLLKPELISTNYKIGYIIPLYNLPIKSIFFNLNIKNKNKYARSGGTYCTLIQHNLDSSTVKIKLPSTQQKIISNFNLVILGRASNIFRKKEVVGKAGKNVLLGKKPSVRGVAMNPVDHPHGGRTKTNSPELTPWGKIAKKNK
jgi:large subunit ribosomal protein L2